MNKYFDAANRQINQCMQDLKDYRTSAVLHCTISQHGKIIEDIRLCNYLVRVYDDDHSLREEEGIGPDLEFEVDAAMDISTLSQTIFKAARRVQIARWANENWVDAVIFCLGPPISLMLLGVVTVWVRRGFYPASEGN